LPAAQAPSRLIGFLSRRAVLSRGPMSLFELE